MCHVQCQMLSVMADDQWSVFQTSELTAASFLLGDQSYLTATSRPCDAQVEKYLFTPCLDYLLPFLPSVGRNFCCGGKGRREAGS